MASKFRALQVTKDGDRQSIAITELTDADLMDGDNGQGAYHPEVPPHSRH
jgi:hypothetical protein